MATVYLAEDLRHRRRISRCARNGMTTSMAPRLLSGVLGTIFQVIGEGNAVFVRFSISTDGQQVLRTKATKLISRTVTATINPDGTAQSGVPDGRTDMVAIEERLERPLELEYFPYRCWSAPE